MDNEVSQLIWCEACCAENWDDVSRWIWAGKAVARSGVLRVPTWCRCCEAELSVGTIVEAVTIFNERPVHREWEDEYLVAEIDEDANGLTGWGEEA